MALHLHDPIERPAVPADQRVDKLYVWVGVRPDGAEGIVCADVRAGPGIINNIPLMASNRPLAEQARPYAEATQRLSQQAGQELEIELRAFRRAPL